LNSATANKETATSTLPVFSIACISAAALGYEVLLMRLFSIIHWHHFAYMIISLALLGYGFSGAVLTLLQKPLLRHFTLAYTVNICLFGISSVACFLIAQRLPFNTEEVLWDLRQSLWLMVNYLLLALPFFFTANAIGLVLRHYRQHIHRLYAADLLGAGLGSLGILGLLFVLFPMQALKATGLLGLVAAMVATWELRRHHAPTYIVLTLIAVSVFILPASWTQLELSPYKSLSQSLRIKDTHVVKQLSSPLGLLSIVESPTIPLRHAPGLSLNATVEPPAQLGVFTDGDGLSVINRYTGDTQSLNYLDQLTSALPYHLHPVQRALILGAGGGSDVLQARYHKTADIDAVELNPQFARLVSKGYANFSGRIYQQPGVELHITEARNFVENSKHQYDLIQVSLLDAFGASSAGLYALSENYLYTVESIGQMLSRLTPGGYLSLTRWVKLPPRDTLKLFATGLDALKRNGINQPEQHLVLIRSWQTSTLLIKNSALSPQDINNLKTFCRDRSFDTVYYPGIQQTESNHLNR
jgi:predicted membrane-bound spermidine synthase